MHGSAFGPVPLSPLPRYSAKLLAEHFASQRTRYQVQIDAETAGLFQRELLQLRQSRLVVPLPGNHQPLHLPQRLNIHQRISS